MVEIKATLMTLEKLDSGESISHLFHNRENCLVHVKSEVSHHGKIVPFPGLLLDGYHMLSKKNEEV